MHLPFDLPIAPGALALLCGFAFLAGLLDAVVGGGGLVQVPAALLYLPMLPVPTVLGTGKFASLVGTATATARYARRVEIPWRALLLPALVASSCSWIGARAVSLLNPAVLKPALLGLLVLMWFYTLRRPALGAAHGPRFTPQRERGVLLAVCVVLGLYDGFFGPGTGSLLVFAFVGLLGYDFLRASAAAKFLNLLTNIGGFSFFAATGQVRYLIAVPMAVCNLLGALVGTRLALTRGTALIRVVFLVVVALLIGRLGWDVWRS